MRFSSLVRRALWLRAGLAVLPSLLPAVSLAAGAAPMPNICTRACWGASAASGITYMSALNRAIVHHTAGNEYNTTGFEASKANVRAIQNLHKNTNGWGDIGYHFLVDKFGYIFEGRHGSIPSLPRGAHDGTNTNSFGFNVMGYYHPTVNNVPTAASMNALYDVIAWRMPNGWSPYGSPGTYGPLGNRVGYVDAHRRVKSTACPGDHIFNPYMGSDVNAGVIRSEIQKRINGTPPPPSIPNIISNMRADFNGDNKDDIVTFLRGPGNNTAGNRDGDVLVSLSNGAGFLGAAKWHEFFCVREELPAIGDVNGDGKDDIITFVRGGGNNAAGAVDGDVYVALSTGTGFSGGGKWHEFFSIGGELPAVADVNGDGRADLVTFVRGGGNQAAGVKDGDVYVALSTGTGFGAGVKWHEFFCIGNEVPAVADFTGDGKADIATFLRGGGNAAAGVADGNVFVSASNGSAFVGSALWHEFFCIGTELPVVGDLNGDLKADIMTFIRGGGNQAAGVKDGDVIVSLSSGTAFVGAAKWHEFFCIGGELPGSGDFTGDGKADIIAFVRGGGNSAPGVVDGNVYVSASTGSGFLGAGLWNEFFCIGGELPAPAVDIW